ncbi:hypothetical protein [Nannocystis pusilla]|uniref:hypothetical protein n=1 Tax=Nannocystis pusilla TaxID=889268 RepID=UPI003B7D1068
MTRLRRRWLPEAVAAAGVAAALSACTPHGPVKGAEKLASDDEVLLQAIAGGVNVPENFQPPPPPALEGELVPTPRIERGEKPAEPPPPARSPRTPKKAPEPKAAKLPEPQEFDGGLDL